VGQGDDVRRRVAGEGELPRAGRGVVAGVVEDEAVVVALDDPAGDRDPVPLAGRVAVEGDAAVQLLPPEGERHQALDGHAARSRGSATTWARSTRALITT